MYLKGLRNFCSIFHPFILLILLGITSVQLFGQSGSGSYSTSFANTENPISEGGKWVNGGTTGLQWSNVRTTPGLAFGTQSGSVNYNDSTAVLSGSWATDQTAQATVRVVQSDSGSGLFEEVELRLRTTIRSNSITGYEINCSVIAGNPYMQIVRWNGAFGSWTELDGRPVGCRNGDVLKATVVGSTITAYKNGTAVFSVNDGSYTGGTPGIGFYLQGGSSSLNSHFGFSNFTAVSQGTGGGSGTDTTPPTVPTNVSGRALSSSQISLAWSASTDNVGVTGYRIYRNNVQVGTSSPTSYTDSGLSANTNYTYKIAAIDGAGNVSAQSSPVTVATLRSADTTAPSVPTNLTASSVTSNSATVSWTASTDNVGVAGYRVFRNGTQIGTTASTSYNDSGLTANTNYSYTVAAYDSANNVSAQSPALAVTTTAATQTQAPALVQVNQNQVSSGTSVGGAFRNATTSGNTIVAYVIWDNTGTVTLSDSRGDAFRAVSAPVTWGGSHKAQVFYATNISGGANTVTATFGTSVSSFGVLYVHEYSGINTSNPVDVTVQASGSSSTLNSGTTTTTGANDLIFGAGVSDNVVTGAGSSFAARDMAYGNITEDRLGSTAGSYSATATHNGNAWGMQMVAFRPATSGGATVKTYSISGMISGGAGATVSLTGAGTASTIADANGNFSFGNLVNGSYTVTPSKSGYTFSPASMNVTVNGSNVTGTSFTATATQPSTWSISGTVSPAASGAGTTLTLNGARSASTTADANGNFTFTGLANGSYTVTPSKSGFTFSPASSSITVNGTNVTGTNFTATANQPSTWSISGSISPAVDGVGATLALSGTRSASTTADGNGNFSFTGLVNGSYVVTPSKSGFTFSPSSSNITVNGANVTGTNFTTTAVSSNHSVDLNWTASTSSSVSGYKVYRSTVSGGPYTLVSSAPVTSTVYTDLNVTGGKTYYYVVTAVDSAGNESAYSNQAIAAVSAP